MNETDEIQSQSQTNTLPKGAILAFARELRLLAAQVERDLRRHEPVSALSALTAIKPLTGALTDAAFAEAMGGTTPTTEPTPGSVNHNGYL